MRLALCWMSLGIAIGAAIMGVADLVIDVLYRPSARSEPQRGGRRGGE